MVDEILQEALNDVQGGAAICFLGAGYSLGARDAGGVEVPSVSALRKEICRFPGLEQATDSSLVDLAEFCEQATELRYQLHSLVVNRLTFCRPSAAQEQIVNLPWRSIFTTNFDDVAERALNNEEITIVTPAFDAKTLKPGKKALYYLHGRARDVFDGIADPSLVLSETNYLGLKERNRNLYSALENEAHAASRIFFIGYSARDAEVASRLFSIPTLRQKGIVVCGPHESEVSLNRLRKFGVVFPIGVDGLADALARHISTASTGSVRNLSYVKKQTPLEAKEEVELKDVEMLMLSGEFSYPAYAAQQRDKTTGENYCINRNSAINSVFSSSQLNRFIISSDLGNGKSIFLDQLTFRAHEIGYEVYRVDTQLSEVLVELDALLAQQTRRVYLVDGLVRHRKIVRHIGKRLAGNSILVVTAGQFLDDGSYAELTEDLGGVAREIDLNLLSASELSAWDRYLERWGFWEGRIEETTTERIDFLRQRCGAENRSIVLSLFRGSKLSGKIESIVQFFLRNNRDMSRAFIAVLINSLCQKHVEWSKLVQWLEIDEVEFKKAVFKSPVGDFMSGSKRWFEFTSTELADHILNSYDFDTAEIVDIYTKIVRETAYSANDPRSGFDSRENLKELMRYRFLTRLFAKQQEGQLSINSVYHRLSSVPRIRENDQFWLQYAMARMEVDDLDNAETYLGTAIGLANKKGLDYSKRQIFDQQARLLLRKNVNVFREKEVLSTIKLLTDALTEKNEPVVHPLRAAEHLLAFLEVQAQALKPALVVDLKDLVVLMKSKIGSGRLEKSQKGETEVIRRNVRDCLLILANL